MTFRRSRWAIGAITLAALFGSACGSGSSATSASGGSSGTGGAAATGTCVDGDTVKLGLLNSTSGAMAISEQTVRDSLLLAKDEINASGGIMGKKIEVVEEDGGSQPAVFA